MKKTLYTQTSFPVLQNRVYATAEAAINCEKGDICLVEDQRTGLIYNEAFEPKKVVYDARYNNEQGLSGSFQRHLEQVAGLISQTLGNQQLIEVGCGKGFFLEMLLKREIDISGFDATYEGSNPKVIKQNFEPGILTQPVKGLILRHVLEHIPDPVEFLFQLQEANKGQGLIYIEVPCFDWICKKKAWFDVYYEHVNYFRLSDFDRLFGKVIQSGHFFGGQYLYVVADLSSLKRPVFNPKDAADFPSDFLAALYAGQDRTGQDSKLCVWGAASKGVIFSLLRQRAGRSVDCVIDVNPAKQGLFLPATGLQVQSPETAMNHLPEDTLICVMNSNYFAEIKEISNARFNYIGTDNESF